MRMRTGHLGRKTSIGALNGALFIPMKISPDAGSALAACRANETRLKVGQPDLIRPAIGAGGDMVAATVI